MLHMADLLAAIPLPSSDNADAPAVGVRGGDAPRGTSSHRDVHCDEAIVHDFGADLPAGHLHVWGGPPGAGKTAFLLSLLYGAAARGRRVVYATYDLPPETLAMRLLAMAARIDVDLLPDPGGPTSAGRLAADQLDRTLQARACLSPLPLSVLPSRGFSTESLSDRLVRMPFRAEVLAVDYLQGVIREPGTDPGVALRALSDMAERLHVAVICAVRAERVAGGKAKVEAQVESQVGSPLVADRLGWIAHGEEGASKAEVIRSRHGTGPDAPLEFDTSGGGFMRADEASNA